MPVKIETLEGGTGMKTSCCLFGLRLGPGINGTGCVCWEEEAEGV